MVCTLAAIYYGSPQLGHAIKKTIKLNRDMLNFDFFFLEKRLGLRFQPYFVYDFSRKIFLMLYFNN